MKKFFVARNAAGESPDASQIIVAFREGETIGTQIDPEKMIGKKIVGFEYVNTNVDKTLFLFVE
ncbi:hypothetical protein [Tepidiforma sp.]|uniref:hypothetical protein n=1 Tax=Tepidiforma sp. TaxID=2682230 RepID=UPI00262C07A3|nr:hypothetical protein [Tepidiforma sp.]MCX7619110.1 hypothetical protein [Tepidiforma sp.]